jgi:hypothetical protein
MPGDFEDCEKAAADGGLAAGLVAAIDAAGLPRPPGPVAALPTSRLPEGAELLPNRLAPLESIAFVRSPRTSAPGADADGDGSRLTALAVLLGAVRLAVTRDLLERTVGHLAGRTSGGEPLLRRQLVVGTLADVLTGIEAARETLLAAEYLPAAAAQAHARVTELDWELAKLMGAAGYLADSPVRPAYVSRLVANCWVPRTAEGGAP